jgi:hypothetical protein
LTNITNKPGFLPFKKAFEPFESTTQITDKENMPSIPLE